MRKPQGISINRILGCNKEDVQIYFLNLNQLLDENDFSRHQIYNCDETGITTVHKPVKVIAKKGKKSVSPATSGERVVTTTVLCACNATGYYILPMMIFKRKTNKPELIDGALSIVGSIMGISDSGWITSELFMDFMKHFAVHARCSPDNKTLLIFDGHNTHTKCLAVIDFAITKGIYLLSLPPHVTNKLQRLDRSFFKPLKAYFNNACHRWMRNHPGRCIKTEHLGELLKEAYLKAATTKNAGSGFRNSGIVPFNPHQLLDDPRKPAEVLSEDVSAMIGDEVCNDIENNED